MNDTTPAGVTDRGWPWDDLEFVNRRYADGHAREHAARIHKQPAEVERAITDSLDALGDRQQLRDQLCDLIIGGLRVALEERPEQLSAVFANVPAVAGLNADVAEVAGAIADLEARRAGVGR